MKRFTWLSVLVLLLGAASGSSAPTVHTVITTECTKYFTWQTLGMFFSHRKSGMPGPITRIMCCTPEEYERLPKADRELVPTHVAPSYTVHPRTGDVYSAYNKPVAVIDWLAKNDVKEEYVLIIDADMIMREPFLPEEVGSKPGRAISAYFGYMKGVSNELAMKHVPEILPRNDTLAGPKGRRGDMVGGFTMMHREDLRRVAPGWLKYTEDVRFDPDAWTLTGDAYSIHKGDRPWISEMYGYSFGAAKADVWHVCHRTAMLYPGYEVADPPKVLHYGLHWQVEGTDYSFDKHWHYDFDPLACPPWDLSSDPRRTKRGLFAHPPRPSSFKTKGTQLLRDLLAIEAIVTLNQAFCERHRKSCPPSNELERECKTADDIAQELEEAYENLELPDPCRDHDARCGIWAKEGECTKNHGFMHDHCNLACKGCKPRDKTVKVGTVRQRQQPAEAVGDGSGDEHKTKEQAAQAANRPHKGGLKSDHTNPDQARVQEAIGTGNKRPGSSDGDTVLRGGADKLRGGGVAAGGKQPGDSGGEQEDEVWDALSLGGADDTDGTAGSMDGKESGVDQSLKKRLQRLCTSHPRWTMEQVRACLAAAAKGQAYEAATDEDADAGDTEQLPREDLDPRQHSTKRPKLVGKHSRITSHVAGLKSKVTGDLHDAGRLLGERVQRTKRIAIKGIKQGEEAMVGRLGWGGVVLWILLLGGLAGGVQYFRGRSTPRQRYKAGRSE